MIFDVFEVVVRLLRTRPGWGFAVMRGWCLECCFLITLISCAFVGDFMLSFMGISYCVVIGYVVCGFYLCGFVC